MEKSMEKYLSVLKSAKLFHNFSDHEVLPMLRCLSSRVASYRKEQALFIAGDALTQVGIVLSGTLRIQKEDMNGNAVIVTKLNSGDMFGEAFVCAGLSRIPVSVWASACADVLFIDYMKIITTCPSACSFHSKLLGNMLGIMAQKLILLTQKMDIVQKKSIRDKLTAYFETCVNENESRRFSIPFNRRELAEYIGVNRSAMSRELGKMQDEGLITFSGDEFYVAERRTRSFSDF